MRQHRLVHSAVDLDEMQRQPAMGMYGIADDGAAYFDHKLAGSSLRLLCEMHRMGYLKKVAILPERAAYLPSTKPTLKMFLIF